MRAITPPYLQKDREYHVADVISCHLSLKLGVAETSMPRFADGGIVTARFLMDLCTVACVSDRLGLPGRYIEGAVVGKGFFSAVQTVSKLTHA